MQSYAKSFPLQPSADYNNTIILKPINRGARQIYLYMYVPTPRRRAYLLAGFACSALGTRKTSPRVSLHKFVVRALSRVFFVARDFAFKLSPTTYRINKYPYGHIEGEGREEEASL